MDLGYLGRQIGGNATGGENSNIIGNFIGNMIENTTGKQGKYDRREIGEKKKLCIGVTS